MNVLAGAILSEAHDELSDDQIIMELFRMARSGRFRQVAPLKEAALEMLKPISAQRIDICLANLADILYENDYQGYASDYRYSIRNRKT